MSVSIESFRVEQRRGHSLPYPWSSATYLHQFRMPSGAGERVRDCFISTEPDRHRVHEMPVDQRCMPTFIASDRSCQMPPADPCPQSSQTGPLAGSSSHVLRFCPTIPLHGDLHTSFTTALSQRKILPRHRSSSLLAPGLPCMRGSGPRGVTVGSVITCQ